MESDRDYADRLWSYVIALLLNIILWGVAIEAVYNLGKRMGWWA